MNSPFVVLDGPSLETEIGKAINERYLAPETEVVRSLADLARLPPERREAVQRRALALVNAVRFRYPHALMEITAYEIDPGSAP